MVELQGLYKIFGVQAHGTSFWGQSEVAGDCASTEYLGSVLDVLAARSQTGLPCDCPTRLGASVARMNLLVYSYYTSSSELGVDQRRLSKPPQDPCSDLDKYVPNWVARVSLAYPTSLQRVARVRTQPGLS